MIPYFFYSVIPLGPVHLQVWGLFVALGILTSVMIARNYANRHGLDPETVLDLSSWAVLGGIIGARLGHVLLYAPAKYISDPVSILRVWEGGMSMFGGFIGAGLAIFIYSHRTKLDWQSYLNALAFAFPVGYGIGRIGCFLIHDHPGVLTSFFLAVKYPGGARLDHGLLLSIVGFCIFFWFLSIEAGVKKGKQPQAYLPLFMVTYGTARFILDFFRSYDLSLSDVRYGALTPAQFLALGFIALGVWSLRKKTIVN